MRKKKIRRKVKMLLRFAEQELRDTKEVGGSGFAVGRIAAYRYVLKLLGK
jgi:hypothetical protein